MAQSNQTLVHIQSVCAIQIRCVTRAEIEDRFYYEDPEIYKVTYNHGIAIIHCCNHPTAKALIDDLISEYGSNIDWYLEHGQAIDPKSKDIGEDDEY